MPLKGSLYMTAAGMGTLVEGVAARRGRSASRSARCRPAARKSRPSCPMRSEKKLSKHKEEFGTTGAIEGVAGPEAANNASAAGVLVPMLTLGLPTSATAAIMLSAFQSYGIQPGPLLLTTQANLVWGLIASLFIANVILVVLNLPLIGLWVRLLKIPAPQLYAGILVFATVGSYGISQSPDRPGAPLSPRRGRLPDAALRFPDRACDHRHDPRAAGRGAVPPRDDHLERRLDGVLHAPAVADAADAGAASAWWRRASGASSSIAGGAGRSMCPAMPDQRSMHDRAACRHTRARPDQRAGRPVLRLPAGAARRRRDQGRAAAAAATWRASSAPRRS